MDSEKIGDLIFVFIILIYAASLVQQGLNMFRFKRAGVSGNPNADQFNKNNQWKKAAKAFGIKINKLKKMSKAEIKTMYRERAKKVHPDKGGDPENFRNLHDAYEFAYNF